MAHGRTWSRPVSKLIPLEVSPETKGREEAEPESVENPPDANSDQAEPEIPIPDTGPTVPEPPERANRTKFRWADKPPIPDQPPIPRKPIVWAKRPPLHSQLTSSSVMLVMLLGLVLFPLAIGAGSSDLLSCNSKGIKVDAPIGTMTMDVCCHDLCSNRPFKSPFVFPMPDDLLVSGLDCSVTYWMGKTNYTKAAIQCDPINPCELIHCYICLDRIINIQCSPTWSSALIGILALVLGSILGTICCLISTFRRFFGNCRWLLRRCCRKPRYLRKRKPYSSQEEWDETPSGYDLIPLEDIEEFGAPYFQSTSNSDRVELIPRNQSYYGPPRFQSTPKTKFRPLTKLGYAIAILGISFGIGCKATTSLTASTEECFSNGNGTSCHFNAVTELKLLPMGQTVNLLLKGSDNALIGTLSFRIENLVLECKSEIETYVRSYRVETLSSKRCPGMGSCTGNRCKSILPNETVPELAEAQNYPGHTHCLDSSSFWFHGCGGTDDACLYYRNYIVPTTKQTSFTENVFQLTRCPTWEYRLRIELLLSIPGRTPIQEETFLYPGRSFHWDLANLTITPVVLGQPPAPVLSGLFLAAWQMGALIPEFPLDLHCASEYAASTMQCSWSLDACTKCRPDHSAGTIRCFCRDLNLEQWINNPQYRLPLSVGRLKLHYHEYAIWAETEYVPVSLTLQLNQLRVAVNHDIARCDVNPIGLSGCYSCRTGAKFRFQCHATFGNPVADIQCQDGINWVTPCSPNSTETYASLNFDKADIETKCIVKCPAGETSFVLKGTLAFLVRSRPGYISSGRGIERTSEFTLPNGDIRHIFWGLIGVPQILTLIGVVLAGAILLYLFVKFNPVFRGYRMLSRVILGLCILNTVISGNFADQRSGIVRFGENLEEFSENHGDILFTAIIAVAAAILIVFCWMIIEFIRARPGGNKISPRQSPPAWRYW